VLVSAKTGQGVDRLLEAIVTRIPAPDGDPEAPLQALVFDSAYDPYRGVVVHVRVMEGRIVPDARIRFWAGDDATYRVEELGLFGIKPQPTAALNAGEVGYLVAGIRSVGQARVGNTITEAERPCAAPLHGFREAKPVVFAAIYPLDADQYDELAAGLARLQLNDSTLSFTKESSVALGFGFRCGFLGLLHLEVVQERLEREFGLGVVLTAPSVEYRIRLQDGSEFSVHTPGEYPDPGTIEQVQEPYVRASIITPSEYIGAVISICLERRGIQQSLNYLDETRMELRFDLPLADIVTDFYDRLKSVTRGYASFDYEVADYRDTDIVRLDLLLNGQPVDALAQLVYRGSAVRRAREVCRKLRDEIPRHQFKIPIQGAIGGQIIARETINAYRKDVTAKLYGGDITRKRKLLSRQAEGKKRLKRVGNVEIPQEAFLAVLQIGKD
jgi:GTP-binding protein LepA